MAKIAVVFGGTGLVGSHLIQELITMPEYEKIIAVTRKELHFSDPKIFQLQLSDFSQLNLLKDKLYGHTYFCCIGTTIKIARTKKAFREIDYGIPEKIAILAENLSVPALVIVSSIGAKASSYNFYLRTKGEMEKSVREHYSGNLKIVRPSLLVGRREKYRFSEKAATLFLKAIDWIFTGRFKKYRGIEARAVARAMIRVSNFPPGKTIFESDELQLLSKPN